MHGVISLQPLPLYNQDLFQKDKWRQKVSIGRTKGSYGSVSAERRCL